MTARIQRCRALSAPYGAAVAQARSKSREEARAPARRGTLRWISAFGSRSARSEGVLQGAQPGREGDRAGAFRAERHPHVPPPDLVAGALDQQSVRARAARTAGPRRRATSPSAYCRSTFAARDQHRPARRRGAAPRSRRVTKRQPRPARTAARRRPAPGRSPRRRPARRARTCAQPAEQFDGGPRRGAVAEVDREGRTGAAAAARVRARRRSSGPCGAAGWGWSSRASPSRRDGRGERAVMP